MCTYVIHIVESISLNIDCTSRSSREAGGSTVAVPGSQSYLSIEWYF